MNQKIYGLVNRDLNAEEESVIKDITQKLAAIRSKGKLLESNQDKISLTRVLQEKFPYDPLKKSDSPPGYRNYVLFHVLIGSTPNKEKSREFDFPEPDSIKTFVNAQYQKYVLNA